jgi:hypothetical protein
MTGLDNIGSNQGWNISYNDDVFVGFSLSGTTLSDSEPALLASYNAGYSNSDYGTLIATLNNCTHSFDLELMGCTDPNACNYESSIAINNDDGSCVYASSNEDCSGNCLTGFTLINGACITSVNGCNDQTAMNYDLNANTDDGSCVYLTDKVDLFFSEYGE